MPRVPANDTRAPSTAELLHGARALVAEHGRVSIARLQRALRIGYHRACHIQALLDLNWRA